MTRCFESLVGGVHGGEPLTHELDEGVHEPRAGPYELLAYHRFGEGEYGQLGRSYAMAGLCPPAPERTAELADVAARVARHREPALG